MSAVFKSLVFLGLFLACAAAHAYRVQDGVIYDAARQPVQLRGVNWFGFETGDHIGYGLSARNWKDMIAQMKFLGLNAVRIPVCPATLAGVGVGDFDASLNPDLVGKNSLEILDTVLAEFDRQEFYILLDHHRLDCNGGTSELWYDAAYSEQAWIGDLEFMANRYKALSHFIGIDLKNEPHGAATWGMGNPATDWNTAAEKASAAVIDAAPGLLVFVEGVQENTACNGSQNHGWGGNLEPLACRPLAIPADKRVLSPHVQGPDVSAHTSFNAADFPANSAALWHAHFGRFRDGGYSIVPSVAGGRYGHGGDSRDRAFQDALVDYLVSKNIRSVFYGAWAPASIDTGGLLQDDWKTVWQDKVSLMTRLWGGPAKASACADGIDNDVDGAVDYPNDPGCSSPDDNDETEPALTPASCAEPIDSDSDGMVDYPLGPGCAAPDDTGDAQVGLSGVTLVAVLTVGSDWGSGYCAQVEVRNTGVTARLWQLGLTVEGRVDTLWNAAYTQVGNTLTAAGSDWNRSIPVGGSVQFGFCAER